MFLVEPATPYDDERRAWLAWAREIQNTGAKLVGIFLTHHHPDHAGGAAFFSRELHLPIFCHELTASRLHPKAGDSFHLRLVADGEPVLPGMVAVHTPGHAPGHLCLFDQDHRWLIAGDMVAEKSTILIPPDDGGDMAEYLHSLEKMRVLCARWLLPAHGEPMEPANDVLVYYVNHRLAREAKVLAGYERAQKSLGRVPEAFEVVPYAYDDTPMQFWPLATVSAQAHLVKLRREGRV